MTLGLSNVMAAMRAPLRLLSYQPQASAPAGQPAAAPAAQTPAVVQPTSIAAPRLMSYQSGQDPEAALAAVRADAQGFMSQFMATLQNATAAVLPALTSLQSSLSHWLTSWAAPAPAKPKPKPASAPKPAPKPKPKPKPASKPKPAPKPKKPASSGDFKSMLGISNQRLASVLGISADSARRNLPMIARAIQDAGIHSKNAMIGILATIKTEVGAFNPINEYGGPSYWAQYNGRSDLGNRPGTNDGVTYHGRGYIQLTGRANYSQYGKELGVDLLNHPDKALDPKIASKVLVQYFKNRGLIAQADQGNWMAVRKGVNGGLNGWDTFMGTVSRLKKAVFG